MKQEKKVKIKIFAIVINGEEGDEKPERDNIRITAEGVMSYDGKRVEICYDEIMGEDGKAKNILSFDPSEPNIVTLDRSGAVKCVMTFSENGRYGTLYHMGFAAFDLTIATQRICNKITFEKGGTLLLDYGTEIQNVSVQTSRFRFDISVIE